MIGCGRQADVSLVGQSERNLCFSASWRLSGSVLVLSVKPICVEVSLFSHRGAH